MKSILCYILLLLSLIGYSQNYVFIGGGTVNYTTKLNTYLNETKSIVTTKLDSVWNQNNFSVSTKPSFRLSFGYSKSFNHNFSLIVGGEISNTRLSVTRDGNQLSSVGLYSIGLPVSVQKKFVINNRFAIPVSLAVGINLSASGNSPKALMGSPGGYTTEIYQYPSGADTVGVFYGYLYNIASFPATTIFTRAGVGFQYIFKNSSYLELGLAYTLSLQKHYYFESTSSYSYSSNTNNTGGYKYVSSRNFGLPYLLAELKYCIPLQKLRVKS